MKNAAPMQQHYDTSSVFVAVIGRPNVGKSTLFTALTKKTGLAANYPFATIDPNVGIVDVPDSLSLIHISEPTRPY